MKDKINFKDLSGPLKVAVVWSIVQFTIFVIAFAYGFFSELFMVL